MEDRGCLGMATLRPLQATQKEREILAISIPCWAMLTAILYPLSSILYPFCWA